MKGFKDVCEKDRKKTMVHDHRGKQQRLWDPPSDQHTFIVKGQTGSGVAEKVEVAPSELVTEAVRAAGWWTHCLQVRNVSDPLISADQRG